MVELNLDQKKKILEQILSTKPLEAANLVIDDISKKLDIPMFKLRDFTCS